MSEKLNNAQFHSFYGYGEFTVSPSFKISAIYFLLMVTSSYTHFRKILKIYKVSNLTLLFHVKYLYNHSSW